MIATAVDVVTAAPVLAVAFVIQQINDGAVPGAAAPGADPYPHHRDHQADADEDRDREHRDVKQPQTPTKTVDFAGEGGGWMAVRAGHEQPARNGEPGTERRQHGGHGDGLPQHHGCPWRAVGPTRTREQRRYGTGQQQREYRERQGGHITSVPYSVGRPPADGSFASRSASARRSASASSGPTRSTKCTSAASRAPELLACAKASTIRPATSSSRP
ncbi:Uncharacterised protein [Mycobacteroides abscessus subsp. massiliense]|nr:Uncharacterised protein [Mycobacteroides abscessus subsp. massiliense]SKS28251.1 Uncharacterised protein [Mycobacteroides abscessus subsp. massiliense]SLJ17322.1 Uncharacterised protein [Mycobacteroides abscessus subsp. massiliense]